MAINQSRTGATVLDRPRLVPPDRLYRHISPEAPRLVWLILEAPIIVRGGGASELLVWFILMGINGWTAFLHDSSVCGTYCQRYPLAVAFQLYDACYYNET